MKPYEKTQEDIDREESDLKTNSIMRWIQNQDAFKFNSGDILVKKTRSYNWDPQSHMREESWKTELISASSNAPKKYVFAFENKLGIGYIRQLKLDGEGYCSTLICVANFDPDTTRFELDPDFIDHTLFGEGEFESNTLYANNKKYRQDAMNANKKLLVKTSSKKALKEWFLGLKVGDELWWGSTFDELSTSKYKVSEIRKSTKPHFSPAWDGRIQKEDEANMYLEASEWREIAIEVLQHRHYKPGHIRVLKVGKFFWQKVSMSQPHPMKDPLCAPVK